MSCDERALAFVCGGHRLVGLLAAPARAAGDVGVVIVVGGPQYRAGSHRLFVRLARALAEAGIPALRFDARGMGDSEGDFPGFEHLTPDIGAAVDALQAQCPGVRRVLLWGLCDAASAALLYWHETRDARVAGLALANPWVRSAASQARTQVRHYYRERLLQREFWLKLLSGRVAAGALRSFLRSVAQARGNGNGGNAGDGPARCYQDRMAAAWKGFPGALLLLMSGRDYTAREFEDHAGTAGAWAGALQRPQLQRRDLPDADHTFSGSASHADVLSCTRHWINGLALAGPENSPACLAETHGA